MMKGKVERWLVVGSIFEWAPDGQSRALELAYQHLHGGHPGRRVRSYCRSATMSSAPGC